jgi:glyoxylase-like metal-dependent hydrolase (beta-lactamase superfamily II)
MNIARMVFNPIAENTWVVWDETLEAAVIDAGNSTPAEDRVLDEFIAARGLKPVVAVNTHGHFDHALGVPRLKQKYGIPFAAHGADGFLLENAGPSGKIFGVNVENLPDIDMDLAEKKEISFGNTTLEIIHTPGHTPGHVCLFEPRSRVVFTGDTLFADSIGRTDLPGGDYSWIMRSIIEKILPLGGDVKVCPGHGPDTTIGREAASNPFITEIIDGDVNFR